MRPRTEGININTYYKYNAIKDNNLKKKYLNDLIAKDNISNFKQIKEPFENITNYLQNSLDSLPSHSSDYVDNYKINIECPKIKNFKSF